MDKELIERMKTAIEGECDGLAIDDKHAAAILEYVLDGYQARIDAERGKEAVGWFVNADCDPDNPHFQQVAKQYEGDADTFPLFLAPQPAIPKGWALVTVFDLSDALESIDCGDVRSAQHILTAMLAAAKEPK